MTIKEAILAAIKKKFPGVNLSKVRLDAIAAKIETIVIDDETKIDAALDSYNDFNPLTEIAKNDDTIRNLQAKAAKPEKKPGDKKPGEENAPEEKPEVPADAPEWAKAILKQTELLGQSVSQILGEKQTTTIRTKAEELLKEIPVKYWHKRALPEKLEDLAAFAEEVKTDYAEFAQGLSDEGLNILSKTTTAAAGGGAGGNGKASDTKQASKEEVESVVANIMN